MRVAVDTSVLLLMVDANLAAAQVAEKAAVDAWLAQQRHTLIVPTPVIAEVAARLSPPARVLIATKAKGSSYEPADLTTKGALIASSVVVAKGKAKTRQELKFDALVIGCAQADRLPLLTFDANQAAAMTAVGGTAILLKAA